MRYKNRFITAAFALLLAACNPLDIDESNGKTKDEAYGYFDNLRSLVSYVYNGLTIYTPDYGQLSGAMRDATTDDLVFSYPNHSVYNIYKNLWTSKLTYDNVWERYYEYIRASNSFLEYLDLTAMERFEYNDKYHEELMPAAEIYPYEVRALRAYYYFELAKRYGDVPLVTTLLTIEDANKVPKTPFHEVVSFIVTECDSVMNKLPESHKTGSGFLGETGRVTKGMVMALKARTLLYAASPLHNPTNDPELWKAAAKASQDIIDSDLYSLPIYMVDPLFVKTGNDQLASKQLIFEVRQGVANAFEKRNLPYGLEGIDAQAKNLPTQNLVDMYEFKVSPMLAEPMDWDDPEKVANPFYQGSKKLRDPRLYRNIKVNDDDFMYNKQRVTLETYQGGAHYSTLGDAVNTGYYMNRFIDQDVSLVAGFTTTNHHHYVLFRYAEVLLNYAEAAYEVFGNATDTDSELVYSAKWAVDQVRKAASMPLSPTTGDYKQYIRDERRRELAFEGHRYWDIRRWKIGSTIQEIYKAEITREGGKYIYKRVELLPKRIWDDKMYLYPIPFQETLVNPNLKQNSGW